MSTDAIGYVLAFIAVGMSYTAVRGRHLLLSVSAAGLWGGLLAFLLNNTSAGANWLEIIAISSVGFIIALFLLGAFRDIRTNRNVSEGGADSRMPDMPSGGGGSVSRFVHRLNGDDSGMASQSYSRGESVDDYRAKVRFALRRDRRHR